MRLRKSASTSSAASRLSSKRASRMATACSSIPFLRPSRRRTSSARLSTSVRRRPASIWTAYARWAKSSSARQNSRATSRHLAAPSSSFSATHLAIIRSWPVRSTASARPTRSSASVFRARALSNTPWRTSRALTLRKLLRPSSARPSRLRVSVSSLPVKLRNALACRSASSTSRSHRRRLSATVSRASSRRWALRAAVLRARRPLWHS